MQTNNNAKKLDSVALLITLFLLISIFFNSIFGNLILNLIASALTLAALTALYCALTRPSRHRESVKRSDGAKMHLVFANLRLLSGQTVAGYISQLLQKSGYDTDLQGENLLAAKDNVRYVVIWDFDSVYTDSNTIYKCEQLKNKFECDAFLLFCLTCSESAKSAMKYLNCRDCKVLCNAAFFKEMKKHDYFPDCPYNLKAKKQNVSEILCYAFNRARFKNYFLLAFIMYLFSYISPFKTYYLLASAALFALAAYSLVNRRFNKHSISFVDEL